MSIKKAYLSLGSNLGNRQQNLKLAQRLLEEGGISILLRSSFYETEPQDVVKQPWFINLVLACETKLLPRQLLAQTQFIERELGRTRELNEVPRGPRTVDIDILLFDNLLMKSPHLTIPHPRMAQRRFVLEPLLEIAPHLLHPETSKPWSDYLAAVSSQQIRKIL